MMQYLKGTVLFLLVAMVGVVALTSAPAPPFTERDKAFYADSATVNFVRPGLVMKVLGAAIASDGTVTARVKFTDPQGLPLDREGITTPGAISCSFIIAYIRPDGQYWSYTTRVQTSPITNQSAEQASADTGGRWAKTADGEYTYTFGKKLPAGFNAAATHSIGIYGSRNLTEFELGTNYDDDVYNFVPAGGPVTVVRDLIKTATCNKCHLELGLHGGSRKTMELCNLCHTPQTIDPDTGNTVDMPVMTHKIHMGSRLPSVAGGKPYTIIGFGQAVHDYSHVAFPANAQNCRACHEDGKDVAQPGRWQKLSRVACGSCHDDIDFSTGKNHAGIVQTSDTGCNRCHPSTMSAEFDLSAEGAHVIPTESKQLAGVNIEILEVTNVKPGAAPTVVFTLKDDSGKPIQASSMSRLRVYLAGPNSDYTTYAQEDAIRADGVPEHGHYWWNFTRALPADAKGSWTVAIEGRKDVTLNPGTASALTIRDAAVNKQMAFSVDGSAVQPRRKVVELSKCNACHSNLSFHGGARNTIEQCVICHNPTAVANPQPQRSIDLGVMVHKIHRGAALTRGYGIANADYSKVGYPGDLRSCVSCHVNGTQQIPETDTRLSVVSPFDYITPAGRTTANCLACHDSKSAAAHASTNTDPKLGEACHACHGPTGAASVSKVHAR
jgi:OmcA/MtrC family decaheme c-type cytochrome